jgi:hypothetical protein
MRALLLATLILTACSTDPDPAASTTGGDAGAGGLGSGAGGAGGGGGSGASGGSGGTGPTTVPMFVAQGHLGRTMISCDDGHTWVANRSDDDDAICWPPPDQIPDCDHDPGAGRGIAFGDGDFVATFGWGAPGSLRRTTDGVAWANVQEGESFGGVAYGAGVYLAAGWTPWRSENGVDWSAIAPAGIGQPVRRFAFVPHDGGRFVLVAEGGGNVELAISSDQGESWTFPSWPAGCGQSIQTEGGIAYGNGALVVLGGNGIACRSTDGGATWTSTTVAADVSSHLVWTGAAFMAWSVGVAHQSADGDTWTSTPTVPASLHLGPTAASDAGTLVGVRGGWQVWYDQQEMYRSTDGITWETLAPSAFVGSHPLRAMAFGHASPSELCPAPE